MERRKVAMGLTENQTRGPAEAPPAPEGFSYYLSKLIVDALLFGALSAVLWSPLPLCLGAIFYLSNDAFIAWVLRKVGIDIVPDSFGANFLGGAVFLGMSWTLLAHWRASLPAWLSGFVPPSFTWPMLIVGALGCAALALTVAGAMRLLPSFGIHVARDSLAGTTVKAVIGFSLIGLVYLLLSTPMVEAWIGAN